MFIIRVHLKGSGTPVPLRGSKARYTKDRLLFAEGSTVTGEFLRSETQGWSFEPTPEKKRPSSKKSGYTM